MIIFLQLSLKVFVVFEWIKSTKYLYFSNLEYVQNVSSNKIFQTQLELKNANLFLQ